MTINPIPGAAVALKGHAWITPFAIAVTIPFLLSGCTNSPKHPEEAAPTAPIETNDPCANRLHDISGLLLMYALDHPGLPAKLDDLRGVPGYDDANNFTCPVSRERYIYNPAGLPYQGGLLVLYDATAAHSGMRWSIWIDRPIGNQALQTKVIPVKESFFDKLGKSKVEPK